MLPSTQTQPPPMRSTSPIAKRSALPTSAAATSSFVGSCEESNGTAAKATIPISTRTTRVSRSVNPREDCPDFMRAAHGVAEILPSVGAVRLALAVERVAVHDDLARPGVVGPAAGGCSRSEGRAGKSHGDFGSRGALLGDRVGRDALAQVWPILEGRRVAQAASLAARVGIQEQVIHERRRSVDRGRASG